MKKHLIPITLLTIILASCTKQEGQQDEEIFDHHPSWTDNDSNDFWGKQVGGGFHIDTIWGGNTTLHF